MPAVSFLEMLVGHAYDALTPKLSTNSSCMPLAAYPCSSWMYTCMSFKWASWISGIPKIDKVEGDHKSTNRKSFTTVVRAQLVTRGDQQRPHDVYTYIFKKKTWTVTEIWEISWISQCRVQESNPQESLPLWSVSIYSLRQVTVTQRVSAAKASKGALVEGKQLELVVTCPGAVNIHPTDIIHILRWVVA